MRRWIWIVAASGWLVALVLAVLNYGDIDWGLLRGKQADAPWIATWSTDLLGSLAVVGAAIGGSWLGGRSRLVSEEKRIEAEAVVARQRDTASRHQALCDARAARLRAAYESHAAAFSEWMTTVTQMQSANEQPAKYDNEAKQALLNSVGRAFIDFNLATTRLQSASNTEILGASHLLRVTVGSVTQAAIDGDSDFNPALGANAEFLSLAGMVVRLATRLDEGLADDFVVPNTVEARYESPVEGSKN